MFMSRCRHKEHSTSCRIDEKTVQEFQRQHVVDLIGIVPISPQMALHYGFEFVPLDVRTGKSARIQEHLAYVTGQGVSIPDSVMIKLVSPEEEPFEMEGGQEIVYLRQPLGHSVIVRVFGLTDKFKKLP